MEFQPAEELAIAGGALVADLDLDADRPQQDGLRQRDVVAIDQSLGGHVLELEQAVLVPEVGEEASQDGLAARLSSSATAASTSSRRKMAGRSGRALVPWLAWRT